MGLFLDYDNTDLLARMLTDRIRIRQRQIRQPERVASQGYFHPNELRASIPRLGNPLPRVVNSPLNLVCL